MEGRNGIERKGLCISWERSGNNGLEGQWTGIERTRGNGRDIVNLA